MSECPKKLYHGSHFEELKSILLKIETGELTVVPVQKPEDVYAGNVKYRVSNGWEIVVFNDCDSFDYIDASVEPDGTYHEYWPGQIQECACYDQIHNYRPELEIVQRVYGMELPPKES